MCGMSIGGAKQRRAFFLALLGAVFLGALSWWNPFFSLGTIFLALTTLLFFLFLPGFFLFFLTALPLFPATNIALGIDLASLRLVIIALFAATVVRGFLKKSIKLPFNKVSFFLLLFLLWSAGSLFYSPVIERTLRKLFVFFTIFPLYFVAYELFLVQGKNFFRKTAVAISLSGLLASALGIGQFFLQFVVGGDVIILAYSRYIAPVFWGATVTEVVKENPSWYFDAGPFDLLRAFSLFPDPHIFSYFLAFVLPVQLALAISIKNKKQKIFFTFTAGLSLLAELLTFSRGGYVGLFLAGSAVAGLFFYAAIKKKAMSLLRVLIPLSVVLLFLVAIPENPVSQRFVSVFDVYEGSNQGRIKIWKEAFSIFWQKPLFGAGLGAYSFEVKPSAGYREPIYAHSLYLEFLAEMGIPGLLLWLGLIFSSARVFLRVFFSERSHTKKALAVALLASLVWFSGHSFFEMPVYSPIVLAQFAVLLASASYLDKKTSTKQKCASNGC